MRQIPIDRKSLQSLTAVILASLIHLLPVAADADVPGVISYSGRLTDGTGWGTSAALDLTFYLCEEETGDTVDCLWSQLHQEVAVTDGYFSVKLGGNGETLPDRLPDSLWLAISVDDWPVLSTRQEVGSVPYSKRAENADTLGWDDIFSVPVVYTDGNKVGIGTANPQERLHIAGSISVGWPFYMTPGLWGTPGYGKIKMKFIDFTIPHNSSPSMIQPHEWDDFLFCFLSIVDDAPGNNGCQFVGSFIRTDTGGGVAQFYSPDGSLCPDIHIHRSAGSSIGHVAILNQTGGKKRVVGAVYYH